MFERLDSSCSRYWFHYDWDIWTVYLIHWFHYDWDIGFSIVIFSRNLWTVLSSSVYSYSTLIRFALSQCFAGPFLRRGCRLSFLRGYFIGRLLSLPIIVSGFNRRREIGDITTVDSGYEGSGHKRALAPPLHRSARCAALRFRSSAASPVLSYGAFFIPLIIDVPRDLSQIYYWCSERFITDWFIMFWEI